MMRINLYYPDIDYTYDVLIWKNDYIEYLWFKHFGKHYDSLSYMLDDKNGEVYKGLEKQWYENKIDEFSIRNEEEFKQFLLDRYAEEARDRYYKEEEEKDPDDWWESLNDDTKERIMADHI